ncbi:K+ transport system, NAD-binding component [Leptolyngbyaceae cyanobacterium JSC-12]|nr:K+ transport system, NAD-binding component [Leptolyngbyaceae cyanobacterium JSC-12]
MQSSLKRMLIGGGFFLATLLIAVAGYILAGWTLLDSVYQVVITVFGVGFGEIGPMTPQLRVFTMIVIIAGCSSVAYVLGGFLQMITEGEIKRALGVRRMMREIDTLKNHVIICGYGRIGQILARNMYEAGQPFVLIDNDPSRTVEAEAKGYLVRQGSATDETVLESVGINRARFLATVLPDDAANVFITLTARSLNPNLIILARGEYPSTEKKLLQAGADKVVSPAAIGALRMSHMITHPASLDFLDQAHGRETLNEILAQIDIQIDELAVTPASNLIGSTVGNVEVRGRGTFIVVALRRHDGSITVHPDRETFLEEGDTLILMGHQGDIPKFAKHHAMKRQMQYRGAKFSGRLK